MRSFSIKIEVNGEDLDTIGRVYLDDIPTEVYVSIAAIQNAVALKPPVEHAMILELIEKVDKECNLTPEEKSFYVNNFKEGFNHG